MKLSQLKAPALIFMSGYIFQLVDHSHKAILAHGYDLFLVAGAVAGVCYIQGRISHKKDEPAALAAPKSQTEGQTIDLKQSEYIKA